MQPSMQYCLIILCLCVHAFNVLAQDSADAGFRYAEYIIYPEGVAIKETSMSQVSSSEPTYTDESTNEPNILSAPGPTFKSSMTLVGTLTVSQTVDIPAETIEHVSTELSTETTTKYFTEYSGLSMQPITTTVTVSLSTQASDTANTVTFTPGPTSLAQMTGTLVTTEFVTSTETAQPDTNTKVDSVTITTTLPPTTTLTPSTTTVMQTVMATAQQTATASTQSGPTTITETTDITTTTTATTTVSTTMVVSGATGNMEPTVYVTVNQDFTLLETVYLPPPSPPPPPPPPPATEPPPPPAEPEQPPPEEAKTTKEAPWFPIYHMHN